MNQEKFQELLKFAIDEEQGAVEFYTALAAKVSDDHVKQTLLDFANQERGHKAKLEAVRDGRTLELRTEKVIDLKIGDYLVDVEVTPDLSFQGALTIAMKKEKAAFRLYMAMAAASPDKDTCDVFTSLAHEEANHKLAFEVQYDELIYQEN